MTNKDKTSAHDNTANTASVPFPDETKCAFYSRVSSESRSPVEMIAEMDILRQMLNAHGPRLPAGVAEGAVLHLFDLMMRVSAHAVPDEAALMAKFEALRIPLETRNAVGNRNAMIATAVAADARRIAPHLIGESK